MIIYLNVVCFCFVLFSLLICFVWSICHWNVNFTRAGTSSFLFVIVSPLSTIVLNERVNKWRGFWVKPHEQSQKEVGRRGDILVDSKDPWPVLTNTSGYVPVWEVRYEWGRSKDPLSCGRIITLKRNALAKVSGDSFSLRNRLGLSKNYK